MPWEQSVHPHTEISLWTTSKENSYTNLSRHFTDIPDIGDMFLIWTGGNTDLEKF